ncbi:MAG: hypothetical protein NTW03_04160 [Verrucomicrobia bacterium]|nr:hypothetical protein [Verrucomicrobiota bacterium]
MNIPVLVQGQAALVPAGSEFQVSGALAGNQVYPSVSLGTSGGVAVWQDNSIDGAGWGIAARLLDATGNAIGVPFRVNVGVVGDQEKPQAALLNGGGAVFVWQGGQVGFHTVYARFRSKAGVFVTGDVQVSQPLIAATNRETKLLPVIRNNRPTVERTLVTTITSRRRDFSITPVVATLVDGNVIVAYAAYHRLMTNAPVVLPRVEGTGSHLLTNSILTSQATGVDQMLDVYARRYTPGGLPVGDELRANQVTKYNQRNPAVAALPNGNFVLVWVSENQGVSETDLGGGQERQDVYARVYNAAGAALTGEFRVNDAVSRENGFPSVAALAGGGFRLAWAQNGPTAADGLDIMTRAFDAQGGAVSETLRVNTYTPGDQSAPKVASCPAGELIVWISMNQDGSREGLFGQWICGGLLTGPEFQVNTTTAGPQLQQSVTATSGNRVLVGWSSLRQGADFDIFGQLYSVSNP